MRLSSSSLVMARARTSCSLRSENRFTLYLVVARGAFYDTNWNHSKQGIRGFHRWGRAAERATVMDQLHRLRRALEPFISPVMHFYWRFSRPATLGARAMVID